MPQNDKTNQSFEELLKYVKTSRRFDFTGYKRASLRRRVGRRMQAVGVETPEDYMDYLEVHPDEFTELFNTILINVTAFFRDPPAWEFLENVSIPAILAAKGPNDPIRIWCAGVASGEEAYTIAMVMAEKLGIEGFRQRVKIYGTDLDEDALTQARQAVYSLKELENIPIDLQEKYFNENGNRYTFNKDLRRSIIFGRHDLIQDAPISNIDLLICRNLLMYFNAETQAHVLSQLYYALKDYGFLFLGKVEMLFTHTRLFSPVDLKQRVFAKVNGGRDRERLPSAGWLANGKNDDFISTMQHIDEMAFENQIAAQLVVDMNGILILANKEVRQMFRMSPSDIGRPIQDLKLSYQPVDLRSAIESLDHKTSKPVIIKEVHWKSLSSNDLYLNVIFTALLDNDTQVGVLVSFVDVTEHKRLEMKLEQANQELETAMEELESTNEELETTNEELQSTIEELETTNEELQSTNEELETMNEELQSTNEELETMNDEMTQRTLELNQAYAFLSSILSGIQGGVIVIGKDLQVQVWNEKSEDLWGVRSDEVLGRNLFSLDIGLPIEKIKRPIMDILNHGNDVEEVTLDAVNRRGRKMAVKVRASRLTNRDQEVAGAIVIIEPSPDSLDEKKGKEV